MAHVETKNITSYDFLKALALLLMIVDHTGHFFFHDEMWFRAVGRLSAPIWLFLIGYANSREIKSLGIGLGILLLASMATGQALLPLYILATMILIRLTLDPVMNAVRKKPQALYPIFFLLFIITIPVAILVEYGAVALVIAMGGYLCRHQVELPWLRKGEVFIFLLLSAAAFYFLTTFFLFPDFSDAQKIVVGGGFAVIMLGLGSFRPVEYEGITRSLPRPVTALLQFCGRRTLEIYVVHLVAFKFICLALGYEGFALFDIKIF